jgi:hypothetical protein
MFNCNFLGYKDEHRSPAEGPTLFIHRSDRYIFQKTWYDRSVNSKNNGFDPIFPLFYSQIPGRFRIFAPLQEPLEAVRPQTSESEGCIPLLI